MAHRRRTRLTHKLRRPTVATRGRHGRHGKSSSKSSKSSSKTSYSYA